jgi:Rho-binding antiterminator
MTTPSYTPIDCNFYDELVLRAMRKTPCQLVFQKPGESEQQRKAIITDLITREGAEYLQLSTGEEIRLDYLRVLDGMSPDIYCKTR